MTGEAGNFGAITGLIAQLWRAMDLGRHDDVLSLLTDDCRWYRDGGWQVGAEALRASLDRRPMDRVVRHILSNFIVEENENGADCAYYLTVYEAHGEKGDRPKPLGLPFAIADMTTSLKLVNGLWHVSQIGMDVSFLHQPAA